MKKIYISKDYKGGIRGVFLSENKDLVNAFHLGSGDPIHEIEEIEIDNPMIVGTPLVTLISAYEKRGYDLKDSETYVFVKRGC